MKTKDSLTHLLIYSLTLWLLTGCASPNPNPATSSGEPFVANTNLTAVLAKLSAWNTVTAPVDPYSGLVGGALGLAALIGGAVAAYQNSQAKTAQAQTQVMAQGVVKAGPAAVAAVQDVASNGPHFGAVSSALNEAMPP